MAPAQLAKFTQGSSLQEDEGLNMDSKQVQESVPVWLASDDLVCPLGQQRGPFKGRPVFVQTVATSGYGPDLDHTLGQLQYVCPHLLFIYVIINTSPSQMSHNSLLAFQGAVTLW